MAGIQILLPVFPSETTLLSATIAVQKKDGQVWYFTGMMPIFCHAEDDLASFRMFTGQLYVNGNCTQQEIVNVFGVSAVSVKRAVKKYRTGGAAAFFKSKASSPKPARVLIPAVIERAQGLLNAGQSKAEVAAELGIKPDTFDQAIRDGRLTQPVRLSAKVLAGSVKSERSEADSQAVMGVACARVVERVAASCGQLREAPVQFETALDVPNGGVLCSLPALVTNGLVKNTASYFSLPGGFYGLFQIVLLLGFLALSRVKKLEHLRYEAPGEWGKLLGLDRIPEVKTLREKIKHLGQTGQVEAWQAGLAKDWLAAAPDIAGVLYADGHVRPYYGSQTRLPRRYVARQRLCLRGMTDYWVNDRQGRPFFVISTALSGGLLDMLRTEIVPRLLQDAPNQPTPAELEANPQLARFTLIFDREGYSPDFFKDMWEDHRIACQTYHKYPDADWPVEEFKEYSVPMAWGHVQKMALAERDITLTNGFRVREIRRLKDDHQTAIISSGYSVETTQTAGHMFNRWSQENFFKYMMENYDIDTLISYETSAVDATKKVVNPAWRRLDGQTRSLAAKLARHKVKFANVNLAEGLAEENVARFEIKKAGLQEEIQEMEKELASLKQKRREAGKHIPIDKLPEEEKFRQLLSGQKRFVDTIKMIAYRAETAMAMTLRDILARPDDARALLRQLYTLDADLVPDENAKTLTVCLHHLASPMSDQAVQELLKCLNQTETVYPGTHLKMVYQLGRMGSATNP